MLKVYGSRVEGERSKKPMGLEPPTVVTTNANRRTRDNLRGVGVFTSQGQAKRFFVEKVIAQAAREGVRMSDTERRMLSFSESDPEFVVSPGVVEKLQAEVCDDAYEAKIARLIEGVWKRDVESDSNARTVYREAFTVLSQGDHYLLVMVDRALRRHLRPWWAFWR